MEKRRLGTSDVQITPILMGTWQAGKRMWTGIEDADSIKAIRTAYEAGITTIDTAEVYGEGHSERIVAAALADVRDKVEYATKVFANHLKYNLVIEACENSLKNLGPITLICTKSIEQAVLSIQKLCQFRKQWVL
jgi:myo-inositol catabolism protein IolS